MQPCIENTKKTAKPKRFTSVLFFIARSTSLGSKVKNPIISSSFQFFFIDAPSVPVDSILSNLVRYQYRSEK